MPKMKTNSGAAKRFKRIANGFKRRRANRNHILTKKAQGRKRHLRALPAVHKNNEKEVAALLRDR